MNNDNLYTFYNITTDKYLKIIEPKYITDDVIKITKITPTNNNILHKFKKNINHWIKPSDNILTILYDVFYPQKNIHLIATEWQPFDPPNWQKRKYLQCDVTDIKDASYFFLKQTEPFHHPNKNYILYSRKTKTPKKKKT